MTWAEVFGLGAAVGGSLAVILFPTTILCWLYVRFEQTGRWLRGECRPYCRDWKADPAAGPGRVVLVCGKCGQRSEW